MSRQETNVLVTFTILGLLGILFIGLKLTGYIAWSWGWVLAPFWVFLALFLVSALILSLVACFGK